MTPFSGLFGLILAATLASSVNAQEFALAPKPDKRELFTKNAQVNKRDPSGYLGINSTIVLQLGDDSYAVLYGVLAGKRAGDSFHYFENQDIGITCKGVGVPTKTGGNITNECFLNGASTGKRTYSVANYGKLSGRMIFHTYDGVEQVGLAAMQWGLSYPNYKKVYKYLKAKGG